ncbi:MAG TPA: FAD-dependent oxidoreductase [Kofleriaceae bacterium]|nr:FAD-dependent oxidoreductase [Kofleriaceae bacterium]
MARSPLFAALRRILRSSPAATDGAAPAGPSRRQVLAALGAAAAIPAVPALSGCGDDGGGGSDKTIVVVGGGVAGLTAAWFLQQVGAKVTVYESSMRPGGRMFTDRTSLAGGQLCELGGELVDTDHFVIPALCDQLGLTLDDLPMATAGLEQDIFFFDGRKITDEELATAFRPVAAKMQLAITASDGDDAASQAEFARIDAMSIPMWLMSEAGLPGQSMIRRLLEVAYLEEYGLEADQQSAWNLLYLIDSMTPDPFRVFGDSDERFHIHQGSAAVPEGLAAALGDAVVLNHALTKVVASGDAFTLTFSSDGGDVTVDADHVVYALPFTRLRQCDLTAAGLSAGKLDIITNLGYGTNAKLMMQFSERHWETAHQSAGGTITDVGGNQLQTTWATSRGQAGAQGVLTNFVGGNRGLAMGQGSAEDQAQLALPLVDMIFPGTSATYLANSAIRQHWPSFVHNKGSYACYKVGQWSYFGMEGQREGNQHFCGEHCSEDFQGYMEGGAETGSMVAAEVMDDLGFEKPALLAMFVDMLTAERPRASFHAGFGRRMRPSQVRRRKLPR